jgi:hypothetical protein
MCFEPSEEAILFRTNAQSGAAITIASAQFRLIDVELPRSAPPAILGISPTRA